MSNLTDFLSLPSSNQSKEIGEVLYFLTSANVNYAEPVYTDDSTFVLDGQYLSKSQYPGLYSFLGSAQADLYSNNTSFNSTGIDFTAIEYGAGIWVAIDLTGVVRTSTNATSSTTWSTITDLGTLVNGSKLSYENGLFFTASTADDDIRTSTDGITWITRNSGSATTSDIYSITYGNGVYVYVGQNGLAGTSTNGTTWTTATSGITTAINDVKYGTGKFVFVGNSNQIGTSTDGTTWTTSTTLFAGQHNKLIYANGLFIVGGQNGTLGTSTDAVTWTAITSGTSSNINALAYGNGMYVYAGNNGAFATSTDAITWSTGTSHTSSNIQDLKYGNGRFVYVGDNGLMRTSTNLRILNYSDTFDAENNFYLPKITKSNYTVVPQSGSETQIAFRSFYKAST